MTQSAWLIALLAVALAAVAIAGRDAVPRPGPFLLDVVAGDLSGGRTVRLDLAFEAGSHRLDASSGPDVLRLARALAAAPGGYLVGAYVDESSDSGCNCVLAAKRALEVKALLVLEGVSPQRIIAAGYVAARPAVRAAENAARRACTRIDVMRVR